MNFGVRTAIGVCALAVNAVVSSLITSSINNKQFQQELQTQKRVLIKQDSINVQGAFRMGKRYAIDSITAENAANALKPLPHDLFELTAAAIDEIRTQKQYAINMEAVFKAGKQIGIDSMIREREGLPPLVEEITVFGDGKVIRSVIKSATKSAVDTVKKIK